MWRRKKRKDFSSQDDHGETVYKVFQVQKLFWTSEMEMFMKIKCPKIFSLWRFSKYESSFELQNTTFSMNIVTILLEDYRWISFPRRHWMNEICTWRLLRAQVILHKVLWSFSYDQIIFTTSSVVSPVEVIWPIRSFAWWIILKPFMRNSWKTKRAWMTKRSTVWKPGSIHLLMKSEL